MSVAIIARADVRKLDEAWEAQVDYGTWVDSMAFRTWDEAIDWALWRLS